VAAEEARRHRRLAVVRTPILLLAALVLGLVALGVDGTGRRHGAAGGLAGGVAVVLVVWAWRGRPRPDPERWRRGSVGEVATAGELDALSRRWTVRHDLAIPGSRANLDHVVIGPGGVWVIDSKAYRAHLRPGWRSVRIGDRRMETASVAWEAQVVADRLGVSVRPLVAVHGHGLPARGRRVGRVPVVPATRVVSLLRRSAWTSAVHPWSRSPHLRRAAVRDLVAILDDTFLPAAWQDALPGGHAGRGRND
jgi:hypothetical protein